MPDERRRKANVRGRAACVPSDVKYNDFCGRFATRTDVGYDELRARFVPQVLELSEAASAQSQNELVDET